MLEEAISIFSKTFSAVVSANAGNIDNRASLVSATAHCRGELRGKQTKNTEWQINC